MVFDIHTLLEFQVLDTVSHPKLPLYVIKIPFRRCFYRTFLFVLIKPNTLQPSINIKAIIPLFVKVLSPSSYKFLLCVLRLSGDVHYGLAKELNHAVFKCLHLWDPCPNREETFDKRLQISCFRAPDIGRFSFYFVDWIICAKATIGKRTISDARGVKECCGGRCCKGSLAYRGSNIRLVGEAIASETDNVLCVAVGSTNKPDFTLELLFLF